jgi:ABC-2 type transport system permease protein
MRAFTKLTWVELKLLMREPFAIIFSIAFPLIVLVVITGSFAPDDEAFGGEKPSDYYLASYVGVVIGAVGLVALPVHLATYWERGILRRFRASSVPVWQTIGAQMAVGAAMAVIGSIVLVVAGSLMYDAALPERIGPVLLGFGIGTCAFLAIGVLIAVLTRNARAAQAVGMLLFFPMWLLAGSGPPPDVMSSGMREVSDVLPLTFLVRALQDPWLGRDGGALNIVLLAMITIVVLGASVRLAGRGS